MSGTRSLYTPEMTMRSHPSAPRRSVPKRTTAWATEKKETPYFTDIAPGSFHRSGLKILKTFWGSRILVLNLPETMEGVEHLKTGPMRVKKMSYIHRLLRSLPTRPALRTRRAQRSCSAKTARSKRQDRCPRRGRTPRRRACLFVGIKRMAKDLASDLPCPAVKRPGAFKHRGSGLF